MKFGYSIPDSVSGIDSSPQAGLKFPTLIPCTAHANWCSTLLVTLLHQVLQYRQPVVVVQATLWCRLPFLLIPTAVVSSLCYRQFHVSLTSTNWSIVLLLHITVLGHALFLLQFILLLVVFLQLVLWVARRGPRAQRFRRQRLFLLPAGPAKWTVFL